MIKKTTSICLILSLTFSISWSKPVDLEKAKNVALNFMTGCFYKKGVDWQIVQTQSVVFNNLVVYYIINL